MALDRLLRDIARTPPKHFRTAPASTANTNQNSARMWNETYQHAIEQRILEDNPIASSGSLQAQRNTFGESQAFDATLESE